MTKTEANTPLQDLLAARSEITAGVSKTKKGFGYNYAPLDEIYNHIKPALEKHKILYSDKIIHSENGRFLETILRHVITGDILDSTMLELPTITNPGKMSLMQAEGANITYARRYNIQLLLGIIGEEDTDAKPVEEQKQSYQKPIAKNIPAKKAVNNDMPTYDDVPMDFGLDDVIPNYSPPQAISKDGIGDKTHSIKSNAYLEQLYKYCTQYSDDLDATKKDILNTIGKGYNLTIKQVSFLENVARKLGYGS